MIMQIKNNPQLLPKVISEDGYEMLRGPNGELIHPNETGNGMPMLPVTGDETGG